MTNANTTSILDTVIEWREPKHARRVYTRLTPSAEELLRFYLGIVKKTRSTQFRMTLAEIAQETGLTKITVRRSNDCLKQLGYVDWRRGFAFSRSFWAESEYVLDLPAIRAAGFIR